MDLLVFVCLLVLYFLVCYGVDCSPVFFAMDSPWTREFRRSVPSPQLFLGYYPDFGSSPG
jgi:hypothetical protein